MYPCAVWEVLDRGGGLWGWDEDGSEDGRIGICIMATTASTEISAFFFGLFNYLGARTLA